MNKLKKELKSACRVFKGKISYTYDDVLGDRVVCNLGKNDEQTISLSIDAATNTPEAYITQSNGGTLVSFIHNPKEIKVDKEIKGYSNISVRGQHTGSSSTIFVKK